ncbi:metalloendopeptidase precursor [Erythrobacter sp. NAP1]|uniref:M23 family metallopeptidase n=1 Tax=Erythrobacter sp. NAP1 TaxID=237727 RepID=UPI00006876EB|nr:M23 family metallopeptidase [Erythrobacter sp. NAP1]EAQ28583.1 metalloendopeptidase precursor [Erythrobacter sp. NAP1]
MIRAALAPTVLGLSALVSCAGTEPSAPADAALASEPESVADAESAASDAAPVEPVEAKFDFSGELTQGGFIRGTVPAGTASASLGEQVLDIAPDGSFFAAFDRDSADSLPLTATLESGRILREDLSVSPREWQIQRVNVAKRPSGSSEAWWKRREPEWNAIQDARAKETGATGWTQDFIWPVKGRISGLFGRQRIYRGEPGSYHSGIDIAPGNGVPFVAPADGVVVLARTGFSLEGSLIIIDHGAGLNSAFLHASRIVVEEGQAVKQGDHIGNVGASGRATGPHLHWGLKWNAARLDPLLFTGPMD